jgi:hypothetical protein
MGIIHDKGESEGSFLLANGYGMTGGDTLV